MDGPTDAEIRRGLVECFPNDAELFSRTRAWHGSAPAFSAVLERDRRVIAHVGVVERLVRVGDDLLAVAGVQNVFVLPRFRGQRLSDGLLNAAMVEAQRRGADAGLLFCSPELQRTYERVGWRRIDASVTRVDEHGGEVGLPTGNFPMVLGLNHDWPDGNVHLRGNDW